MLNELGPWLQRDKAKDLLKRLENRAPDQALPAEYELALSWAVAKTASLEIDRPMGSRTPDIYSTDLLASAPLVVDVAAVDDVSLSGIATMRRARNIINSTCDELRRRSSHSLYFTFGETSGYAPKGKRGPRFFRRRLVSPAFQMTPELRGALKTWLADEIPTQPLLLRNNEVSVTIAWRGCSHPFANIFCAMPSLAYDLRENPLFRVLKEKSKQLRDAPAGVRRAIFLGNAGCRLLDELGSSRPSHNTYSGGQIIMEFLEYDRSIDFVFVFRVERQRSFGVLPSHSRVWRSRAFSLVPLLPGDYARLDELQCQLPPPYLSGYEAHSWHEQEMCGSDARGRYLGSNMTTGNTRTTMRFSALALQELMAGRISAERFGQIVWGRDGNRVLGELASGRTISDIRFESEGINEDDDYVVVEFRLDPAAAKFKMPSKLKPEP